jgi:hypothetical protein
MKNLTITLLGALALGAATSAQGQVISVGIKGGVANTTVNFGEVPDFEVNRIWGFQAAGVVAVGLGEMFSLQVEGRYARKGMRAVEGSAIDAKFDLSYIEAPLLAVIHIPTGSTIIPRLYAGPAVAFELSCNIKGQVGGADFDADCNDPPFAIRRKSTDFGVVFGGGIDIQVADGVVTLDAGYNLGLANLEDEPGSTDSFKNRALMASVGFLIPIGGAR